MRHVKHTRSFVKPQSLCWTTQRGLVCRLNFVYAIFDALSLHMTSIICLRFTHSLFGSCLKYYEEKKTINLHPPLIFTYKIGEFSNRVIFFTECTVFCISFKMEHNSLMVGISHREQVETNEFWNYVSVIVAIEFIPQANMFNGWINWNLRFCFSWHKSSWLQPIYRACCWSQAYAVLSMAASNQQHNGMEFLCVEMSFGWISVIWFVGMFSYSFFLNVFSSKSYRVSSSKCLKCYAFCSSKC